MASLMNDGRDGRAAGRGGQGANCLIDDLAAVAKGNELCNRYGLDTISVGAAIAFGMEAFERGLIKESDTDGIKLTWGNDQAMVAMVEAIGQAKGFGRILGLGVRRAANEIGREATEFAVHVQGLEFPAHDPRARFSTVLSYTTSNRGACHLNIFGNDFESATIPPKGLGYDEVQDPYAVEGKAAYAIKMQNLMAFFDAFTVCKFIVFGGVGVTHLAEMSNAVTGWNLDVDSLLKIGARCYTVKRIYNNRLGITRKDDALPPRIANLSRDDGGAKDRIPPQGELLNDFYKIRSWDEFGRPTPEVLRELEIEI